MQFLESNAAHQLKRFIFGGSYRQQAIYRWAQNQENSFNRISNTVCHCSRHNDDHEVISFKFSPINETSENSSSVDVSFIHEDKFTYLVIEDIQLKKPYVGSGLFSDIFKKILELNNFLGDKPIILSACSDLPKSNGIYTWLKYGFLPHICEKTILLNKITERAKFLSTQHKLSVAGQTVITQLIDNQFTIDEFWNKIHFQIINNRNEFFVDLKGYPISKLLYLGQALDIKDKDYGMVISMDFDPNNINQQLQLQRALDQNEKAARGYKPYMCP